MSDKNGNLYSWIEKKLTENDKTFIEETVKAYSEYIYAVDAEYLYNKTFLNDFIDDFFYSTEMLRIKKECLEQILNKLEKYKKSISINLDGAWRYDGKKITLSDSFDKSKVNTEIINYQIKRLDNPLFVIAGVIDITKKDENIEEVVNLFNDRLNKKI